MAEHLLQSIKRLRQLLIHLPETLKHFLYITEHLLQSMKRLRQLLIHLSEILKRFL
jgi:hypothetical protein